MFQTIRRWAERWKMKKMQINGKLSFMSIANPSKNHFRNNSSGNESYHDNDNGGLMNF